jgi:membrane protease subunit HflK
MAWNEPGGNGKDPWGNRKNEDGPPDLDELVKKMQDKLGGLLGGGNNDGQGGGSNKSGGDGFTMPPPKLLAVILVIGLLIWAAFGLYIVQPAERGVQLLFGEYAGPPTEQGLNWFFPYPVGKVYKVNVEEVRAFPHRALMLTQDENIVAVELEVQYNVADAAAYLFNVRSPDMTLQQATESALREVVGTTKMDDVLTIGRAEAAALTKDLTQEMLDRYDAGLLVRSVNMQNAQPPEAVQAAFADVIKAREDEERHKNTAQAYANEVIQKAGGDADRMRQEAEGYKAQVIAHAEGEAHRFESIMAEYQKAPEVTRERLYLETVQNVLSNSSKIMLDTKNSSPLMYLPLDKMLGRGTDLAPATAENSSTFRPNPTVSEPEQINRRIRSPRSPRQ